MILQKRGSFSKMGHNFLGETWFFLHIHYIYIFLLCGTVKFYKISDLNKTATRQPWDQAVKRDQKFKDVM